ncbi:hypothetical protein GOP47_0002452, partial [Adiantum capillus-veneris]
EKLVVEEEHQSAEQAECSEKPLQEMENQESEPKVNAEPEMELDGIVLSNFAIPTDGNSEQVEVPFDAAEGGAISEAIEK